MFVASKFKRKMIMSYLMKADEFLPFITDTIAAEFPTSERKNKVFKRNGSHIILQIKVKKTWHKLIEPWQRVGGYADIEIEIHKPLINKLLRFPKRLPVLKGIIPSNQFEPNHWHCDDNKYSIDKMCVELKEKLQQFSLEAFFQELENTDLLEQLLWTKLESKFPALDCLYPEPLKDLPFKFYKSFDETNKELCSAAYVACRLVRNDFEFTQKFLESDKDSNICPPAATLNWIKEIMREKMPVNEGIKPLKKSHWPEMDLAKKPVEVENYNEAIRDPVQDSSTLEFCRAHYPLPEEYSNLNDLIHLEWNSILAKIAFDELNRNDDLVSSFSRDQRIAPSHFYSSKFVRKHPHVLSCCRIADIFSGKKNAKEVDLIEKDQWLQSVANIGATAEFQFTLPQLERLEIEEFLDEFNNHIIDRYPNLKELKLEFDEEYLKSLTHWSSLLQIRHLRLRSEFDKEFRDLLKSGHIQHLDGLYLEGGDFSALAMNWLTKPDMFTNLKFLELPHTPPGAQKKLIESALFNGLESIKMECSVDEFIIPPYCKRLDLSVNYLKKIENESKQLNTLLISGFGEKDELIKGMSQSDLKSVQHLSLEHIEFFDSLKRWSCKNIQSLELKESDLTPENILPLNSLIQSFGQLEILNLNFHNSYIEKKDAEHLFDSILALKKLKVLRSNIPALVEVFLEKGHANLQTLQIDGVDELTLSAQLGKSFSAQKFSSLRFLCIENCNVQIDFLAQLASSNLPVWGLRFAHCDVDTFSPLVQLSGLPFLQYLSIQYISDEDEQLLKNLEKKNIWLDTLF